jgi:hypothetical protein
LNSEGKNWGFLSGKFEFWVKHQEFCVNIWYFLFKSRNLDEKILNLQLTQQNCIQNVKNCNQNAKK